MASFGINVGVTSTLSPSLFTATSFSNNRNLSLGEGCLIIVIALLIFSKCIGYKSQFCPLCLVCRYGNVIYKFTSKVPMAWPTAHSDMKSFHFEA